VIYITGKVPFDTQLKKYRYLKSYPRPLDLGRVSI